MGVSVFAERMGFFHKGSGGKGVAPGDVCLSPPTPPAGPVPVPYVNMLSSGDLAKGSKSVKFQGEPTALENASEVSTSNGNEAGTQGGGVVTHKTKGKGVFKLWSFVVKVEGKGVGRHGDIMAQNTASDLPNCIDQQAMNDFEALLGDDYGADCGEFVRSRDGPAAQNKDPSEEQVEKVNGKPCWECKMINKDLTEAIYDTKKVTTLAGDNVYVKNVLKVEPKADAKPHYRSTPEKAGMTHDHQPPMNVAWKMGGCKLPQPAPASPTGFQQHMASAAVVKPHCRAHSNSQGPTSRGFANNMQIGGS